MKNLIRVSCGAVLLALFSSSSFAWGPYSGWVGYTGMKYCFAQRNGISLMGQVHQESVFVCQNNFCVAVGTAYVDNVTSTTDPADLRLRSRQGANPPFIDVQLANVPAFARTLSWKFDTGSDGNITSQCAVQ